MEAIKLIGVLIVVIGLILKLDTLATVIVAGLVTGLVSGMNVLDILTVLGESFLKNRLATLFVLTLPVIGICERYGLKDKATDFIKGLKVATTGRIISLYMIIRSIAAAFSLRIGGHPQFIRPLINPMAQGAANANFKNVDDKSEDDIKGLTAAAENFGNFFSQNCFVGASGTLLITTTLVDQGFEITAPEVAKWSVVISVIAVLLAIAYFLIFDLMLNRKFIKGAK